MIATLRANLLACALGLAAAIFLIIAIIQTIELNGLFWIEGVKDRLERVQIDNNELRAAAKEAERLNQEQVDRIVTEQDRISKDVEANLGARLERLRSELRSKAAKGSTNRPQASPDGKAPGNPDAEAGVCIPTSQFLLGAEYEEKLDQWINWYEMQLKVERQYMEAALGGGRR
jgi:hypothetical protein